MSLKKRLKGLARRWGFDIIRYTPRSSPVARRTHLFQHYGIDLVLDVGASSGGYARDLRETGYQGHIVSFEPNRAAFDILAAHAHKDSRWEAHPTALGNTSGTLTLNVSRNQESSSFLQINPKHTAAYPGAAYVRTEVVDITRLDDIFSSCSPHGAHPFLKIDTQGFEHEVLTGAEASLPDIVGVQIELSLVPLYDQEPSFLDLVTHLQQRGFALMSLQPVIDDPVTGQLLQADGLFFRG